MCIRDRTYTDYTDYTAQLYYALQQCPVSPIRSKCHNRVMSWEQFSDQLGSILSVLQRIDIVREGWISLHGLSSTSAAIRCLSWSPILSPLSSPLSSSHKCYSLYLLHSFTFYIGQQRALTQIIDSRNCLG